MEAWIISYYKYPEYLITISMPYGFTIIKSNFCNQAIHIPYFSISTTLLYHYMKNLLPNIYLLNNKQGLNAHLNET